MPAHVTIELNKDVLAEVVAELQLSDPPTFTLNSAGREANSGGFKKVRGTYHPGTNHVTVTSQGESYEREGLYVLTKHIRFTVLHELRHAWQREHWTREEQLIGASGPYHLRPEEIDANSWAEYASPKFTSLVKAYRTRVGKSGFASLDRVARKG